MNRFYQKSAPVMFVVAVSVLSFVASCTKSVDLMTDCRQESVAKSQFSVSETEALSMLEKDLTAIYGEDNRTRATSARRVKNIKSIGVNRAALSTRSASIPDDVDELLYVVEFEDGQGSAVLGADKRVEPVFAILDQTVLTAEDIENAMSPDADQSDLTTFVAGMICSSAMSQLETYADILPPDIPKTTRYETRYDTVGYEKVLPLLNTKWGQKAPYNCCYPNNHPAGCAVIACAQIMQYHQFPNPFVIDGTIFSWNSVNKYAYNSDLTPSDADRSILGEFIYALGRKMKMDDNPNGTSVITDNAALAIRNLGYSVSKVLNYNTTSIIDEIRNLRPVYTRGDSNLGGHGWVVDGLLRYTAEEWLYEIETDPKKIPIGGDGVVKKTLVASTYVGRLHCNYGYYGDCDGYYSYGIFDLSTTLPAEFVESSEGDVNATYPDSYNFNKNLLYFTINKN